jgi:hypothetical protein
MRILISHRTLIRAAGLSAVATALALGGCQTKSVSLPSNEPLVTTSPKVGNIGQSQLPAIAAATGKREISVADNSNSWVLRRINAGKQQSTAVAQTTLPAKEGQKTKIAAPAASSSRSKGLRDVSLAEIPLLDPTHYDPTRLR